MQPIAGADARENERCLGRHILAGVGRNVVMGDFSPTSVTENWYREIGWRPREAVEEQPVMKARVWLGDGGRQ